MGRPFLDSTVSPLVPLAERTDEPEAIEDARAPVFAASFALRRTRTPKFAECFMLSQQEDLREDGSMGSCYSLDLGDVTISNGKNYLQAEWLLPFQSSDLLIDELDDVPVLRFDAPARVVARRLDLLGHSLRAAEASYAAGLPRARVDHPRYPWPPDLAGWQNSLHDRVKAMEPDARSYAVTTESLAWEDYNLGFPGGLWESVRALIEVAPDASMSLDLSALAAMPFTYASYA